MIYDSFLIFEGGDHEFIKSKIGAFTSFCFEKVVWRYHLNTISKLQVSRKQSVADQWPQQFRGVKRLANYSIICHHHIVCIILVPCS